MQLLQKREQFEQNKVIYESAKLTFHGVEGFDDYPFEGHGRMVSREGCLEG